jgi:hypothetical protein
MSLRSNLEVKKKLRSLAMLYSDVRKTSRLLGKNKKEEKRPRETHHAIQLFCIPKIKIKINQGGISLL